MSRSATTFSTDHTEPYQTDLVPDISITKADYRVEIAHKITILCPYTNVAGVMAQMKDLYQFMMPLLIQQFNPDLSFTRYKYGIEKEPSKFKVIVFTNTETALNITYKQIDASNGGTFSQYYNTVCVWPGAVANLTNIHYQTGYSLANMLPGHSVMDPIMMHADKMTLSRISRLINTPLYGALEAKLMSELIFNDSITKNNSGTYTSTITLDCPPSQVLDVLHNRTRMAKNVLRLPYDENTGSSTLHLQPQAPVTLALEKSDATGVLFRSTGFTLLKRFTVNVKVSNANDKSVVAVTAEGPVPMISNANIIFNESVARACSLFASNIAEQVAKDRGDKVTAEITANALNGVPVALKNQLRLK